MSKDINNLVPTTGGFGGGVSQGLGAGYGSKGGITRGSGPQYSGETYDAPRATDSYTRGLDPNMRELELAYHDCEGSLYWLHKKERLRFPYDLVCLGDNDEQAAENFLTVQETREIIAFLYTIYSNSELAIATGMSRSRLSNYKRGVSRAPLELRDFANKHRQAA